MRPRLLCALAPVLALSLAACDSSQLAPTDSARAAPSLSNAALAFTVVVTSPVDIVTFVSCAAGGAGEVIDVSGPLKETFHITATAAGTFLFSDEVNPQGISGVGLTTGTKYQATGLTRSNFTAAAGATETYVNNFRMISAGAGGNLMVHENSHLTIDANGVPTAAVDNLSFTCQ